MKVICTYLVDIDECAIGTHNCSQNCHNIPGSYQCSCDQYFDLDEDAQTCLGIWPSIIVSSKWLVTIIHTVKSEVAITGQNSLEELETLSLQCTAIPSASISWLKRNSKSGGIKLLTSSTRVSIFTKEVAKEGKMATLGNLTIIAITEVDAGNYLCEAQSGSESIPATEEIVVNINGE